MRWLLIISLLTSCSAEWHLNKAIQKKPSLKYGKEIVFDTIIVTKTRTLTDTLELWKDTTIYKDKVILDIKYLPGQKLLVKGTCVPDTIRITKTIKPRAKYIRPLHGHLWFLIPIFVLGIVLYSKNK
jgi:hypothetical protein